MINFTDNAGIIETTGLSVAVNEFPEKYKFNWDDLKTKLQMIIEISPTEKIYHFSSLVDFSFTGVAAISYQDCEDKIEAMFHKKGIGGGGGVENLQEATDGGNVTTNPIVVDSLFVSGANGIKFNMNDDGTAKTTGFVGNIQFTKATGELLIQISTVSVTAGQLPSYASTYFSLGKNGGITKGAARILDDYADDVAAAVGLIPVGGSYHNAGILRMRLS